MSTAPTKHPGGRPRVRVKPEQVKQLRDGGSSWRQIASALRIEPLPRCGCTTPMERRAFSSPLSASLPDMGGQGALTPGVSVRLARTTGDLCRTEGTC